MAQRRSRGGKCKQQASQVAAAVVRLPSGVVEVLQVPEEAGLFPRVAGRIFVQDVGHACRMCWERVRSRLGRRTTHGAW